MIINEADFIAPFPSTPLRKLDRSSPLSGVEGTERNLHSFEFNFFKKVTTLVVRKTTYGL